MSLRHTELRAILARLELAESVPVSRVVRDALEDARRLHAEYSVLARPSVYATSRRGRDLSDRRLAIFAYSQEHGIEATAREFSITMRRVYTVRHLVRKEAA